VTESPGDQGRLGVSLRSTITLPLRCGREKTVAAVVVYPTKESHGQVFGAWAGQPEKQAVAAIRRETG